MITVFSIKTDDKKDHVFSYCKYEIKQEFRINDAKQEEAWHVQRKSGSSWGDERRAGSDSPRNYSQLFLPQKVAQVP